MQLKYSAISLSETVKLKGT